MTTAWWRRSRFATCSTAPRQDAWPTLKRELPKTYQSPTMSPHCDDEKKYGIVEKIVGEYEGLAKNGGTIAGQKIRDLVTVNGVRVMLEDGTWGLVRASSNKPELVIVVESPVSEANKVAIFRDIEARLATLPRSASTTEDLRDALAREL